MREISFQQALLEASDQLLELDPRVYLMGLGVPDPKGIFGTTLGLQKNMALIASWICPRRKMR